MLLSERARTGSLAAEDALRLSLPFSSRVLSLIWYREAEP
jgi:hypothetical protein